MADLNSRVKELARLPANKTCFECDTRGPLYVDISTGAFVCTDCSGLLRGLTPPHRVKSVSAAAFTQEEVTFLQQTGNKYCKEHYLANWGETDERPDVKDKERFKSFLKLKYERKKWAPEVEPVQKLLGHNVPALVVHAKLEPPRSPQTSRALPSHTHTHTSTSSSSSSFPHSQPSLSHPAVVTLAQPNPYAPSAAPAHFAHESSQHKPAIAIRAGPVAEADVAALRSVDFRSIGGRSPFGAPAAGAGAGGAGAAAGGGGAGGPSLLSLSSVTPAAPAPGPAPSHSAAPFPTTTAAPAPAPVSHPPAPAPAPAPSSSLLLDDLFGPTKPAAAPVSHPPAPAPSAGLGNDLFSLLSGPPAPAPAAAQPSWSNPAFPPGAFASAPPVSHPTPAQPFALQPFPAAYGGGGGGSFFGGGVPPQGMPPHPGQPQQPSAFPPAAAFHPPYPTQGGGAVGGAYAFPSQSSAPAPGPASMNQAFASLSLHALQPARPQGPPSSQPPSLI